MSALKKIYGEIAKVEDQNDGTLKVWGIASSQTEDSDGETITADAMKAALPDYMRFGAVREMHQSKAAGTALEAEVQDDGMTKFCAHVVDSEAVKKVKTGVYKGFSIGGKVTKRDELNKTVITGLKLIEVSLVDRPANPEAVITMYKAEALEPKQVWHCGNPAHVHIAKAEALECIECGANAVEKADDPAATGSDSAENTANTESPNADQRAIDSGSESQKAQSADDLKKGMWSVQDFAGALQSLGYICASAEWEKQAEGDGSPVPAQLRAWLAQGVEIFKTMAAEELTEMLADLKEQAGEIDVIEMAAKIDIEKAGARNSKSDLDKIQAMHDNAVALGADCGSEKSLSIDDLAKMDSTELEKVDKDTLEKFADAWFVKFAGECGVDEPIGFVDYITKVNDELATRRARIEELEAQPVAGKGVLRVVSKADDLGGTNANEPEPIRKADGSIDELATEMRKALNTPETVNKLR